MANRVMKSVKSPANGLTILSVTYVWDGGVTVTNSTGNIDVTATAAKSVQITLDRYVEMIGWYCTAQSGGAPLGVIPTGMTTSGNTMTGTFAMKKAAVDDGSLVWNDNAGSYSATFIFVVKNSKARP